MNQHLLSNESLFRKSLSHSWRKPLAMISAMLLAGVLSLALWGCAATPNAGATAGKTRQAITCPQCKMVAVTVPQTFDPGFIGGSQFGGFGTGYGWGGIGSGFGWGGSQFGALSYTTVYEDKCPGCKGVLKTFFSEGQWKHKCSTCKEKPFTCPVSHRS